ncbi:MAG: thrombospondin type 3 repeat-containing protein [bacterium]
MNQVTRIRRGILLTVAALVVKSLTASATFAQGLRVVGEINPTNEAHFRLSLQDAFPTSAYTYVLSTSLVPHAWGDEAVRLGETSRVLFVFSMTNNSAAFFRARESSEEDFDADGLSNLREFELGTDAENLDTDGDGLADGWEVGYGIDPLSSAGNDGADGDPDGDSLTNAEECNLGTNPKVENEVQVLGPADVTLECRSIETRRSKCGFAEYTDPSDPPKFYLHEVFHEDYETTSPNQQPAREFHTHMETSIDAATCAEDTYWTHTSKRTTWDPETEEYYCAIDYSVGTDRLPYPSTNYMDTVVVEKTAIFCSFDFTHPEPFSILTCEGPGWGTYYTHHSWTAALSNEYDTPALLANAVADLDRCGGLAAIEWNTGVANEFPLGVECAELGSSCAALRDLATNELSAALRRIQYRYRFSGDEGVIYRMSWAHRFIPEVGPTQVVDIGTMNMVGSGSTQYIDSAAFVIDPPATDGTVEPLVVKVEIVGPDKTSTWPCTCDQSRVIIGARIVPALPNQTIEWSFVGDSLGATITEGYPIGGNFPTPPPGADFYATVRPGSERTGQLTVRAKIAGTSCHSDTVILVRAVPTGIQQTMQNLTPPPSSPYTAYYKHRFYSSGGSLNGVEIFERVVIAQDPFQSSGFPINYGDTDPWTLDSDGLMDEWDEIRDAWNADLRDLNRWLPTPCHSGLPVVMSTPQSFAWRCLLCLEYNEFDTHDIHSGFNAAYDFSSCGSLDNPEYVIVNNGSDHQDEYQSTPFPVLGDATVMPASIPADGTNTALVTVDCCWIDSPQGRSPPQQWSWVAGQDPLGCSYQVLSPCSATITAGTTTGQVAIGLYADWQCNYETAVVTLTSP